MDAILENFTIFMMVGIVIVIGVSQFNRAVGGALGVLFWLSVLYVGNAVYERGGAVGLPGVKFPREGLYVLCLVFAALHGFTAVKTFRARGRMPKSRGDSETEG